MIGIEFQLVGLAAAYLIIEIVKFFVNHMSSKKMDTIWEVCLKMDTDKIIEKQEKMWDILRDITHTQKDIANILSKILDKLD